MANVVEKEKIKPFVSCPCCLESYDEHNRRPKNLICDKTTHPVCVTCIRRLIDNGEGTFKCPVCRCEHILPPDVDLNEHYKDNTELLQLSDLLQNQISPSASHLTPRCEHCEQFNSDIREAVAWCDDCSTTLCKQCRQIHDAFPCHPQSTPINKIDLNTVEKKTFCDEHKGKVINLVCYKHDEVEFLCSMCAKDRRHRGHELKDLKTQAENRKREIDELFTKAVKKNDIAINKKRMLLSAQGNLPINVDAVKTQLKKCQDHLMKLLQEHNESKQREFLRIKEETESSLKKETEETTQSCCKFENIANKLKKFNQSSPVTKMKDTMLLENLREYLALEIDDAPTTNVYMKVEDTDAGKQIEEMLQRASYIKTIPSGFKLSYPKLAFRDNRFELVIQSVSEKEICTVGGLPIRARINCPCCDVFETIIPNYEVCGKYVLRYTPKSTGEYKFDIYVEGITTPIQVIEISVHLLTVEYEKVVVCNEVCQIKALFDASPDDAAKLRIECKNELGDNVKLIDENVTRNQLNATFHPNQLGKMKMFITFDGTRIAGPLTNTICKRMIQATMEKCEITHLASNRDGSVYLCDTPKNKRIVSIKPGNEPVPVDDFDNEGTSFIAFDKAGNQFVLFVTFLNDASTTKTKLETHVSTPDGAFSISDATPSIKAKTELHISTAVGKTSGILQSLKNPAGFAVSPSGSVFAVSDREEHCIFLFHTADVTDKLTSIKPFKTVGKEDQRLGIFYNPCLGTFNNPTAICINNENRLFVCDKGNGRVQELTMDGKPLSVYGPEILKLEAPEAICLSPEGFLLISGRDKLVTFNVCSEETYSNRRPINEVEISCSDQTSTTCNFNHLICCLSDNQVLRFCCGNNDMRIFIYVGRQLVQDVDSA